MMTFTTRPRQVEAWFNDKNNLRPMPVWLQRAILERDVKIDEDGDILVGSFDSHCAFDCWIIRDDEHQLSVMKTEEFWKTYQANAEAEPLGETN